MSEEGPASEAPPRLPAPPVAPTREGRGADRLDGRAFAGRALIAVGMVLAVAALALLLWYGIGIVLLLFACILLAIGLDGLRLAVSRVTGFRRRGWSLLVVFVVLGGLAALTYRLLAPDIGEQAARLSDTLPTAMARVEEFFQSRGWGRALLSRLPERTADLIPGTGNVLGRVTGIFSTTLGVIINVVLFLFIGVYLAAQPRPYVNGILSLAPASRRERAGEVLSAIAANLRWWLLGRFISMVTIGVLTAIGLAVLGIPLAPTLGLFAAVTTFVPYVGPILGLLPAALLALLESPTKALQVTLLYLGIQIVETYVLTPLIERRSVSLPPALTVAGQLLVGLIAGPIGLILATPLTATIVVLVRMLYVEDVLGERRTTPGRGSAPG